MLKKIILAIFLLWGINSAFAEEFPFIGTATKEGVNVRSGPNTNFESLYKTTEEEKFIVAAKLYNWYKVMLPKDKVVYISARYVNPAKEQTAGVVTADRVNIRARGGEQYTIMAQASKGEVIGIVEKDVEWYAIRPLDNCYGWIHENFIKYSAAFTPGAEKDILKKVEIAQVKEEKAEGEEKAGKEEKVEEKKEKAGEKKGKVEKKAEIKLEPIEVVGVIRPRGRILGSKWRHKLLIEGKPAYYLEGEAVVLNNYINYKVRIVGDKKVIPSSDLPVVVVKKVISD